MKRWNTIRVRTFLPTILILILFPIAAFMIFSVTSGRYLKETAAAHVESIITYIQETENGESALTEESNAQKATGLLAMIREYMHTQQPSANLLIFNRKMEEIYPKKEGNPTLLSEYWKNWITKDRSIPNTLLFEEIDDCLYAVKLYQTEHSSDARFRYYLVFKQVPDVSSLLSQTTRLTFKIWAIFLLLSSLLVWKLSESISRPIAQFSNEAKYVGTSESTMKQLSFSIDEIENLRLSFCTMEDRLQNVQDEKNRIFQNVSHDLKTPLVSIIGYASGLSDGIVKDPQKAYEIILEESQRMNRMVDSVLTLSKLECNAWESNKLPIILDDFLLEQIEILRGPAMQKELLFLHASDQDETIEILTDTELLIRIIQNVCSNCIRYADSTVEIRLWKTQTDAVIEISDDGPGIAPDDMEHICERYYRGKKGNHGLGLAIVKSGMEYLGGHVEIFNKEQEQSGAVFRLYLPL